MKGTVVETAIDKKEKLGLLDKEMDQLISKFEEQMVPVFNNALAKLPENQQTMITSFLVMASTQKLETAIELMESKVFQEPLSNIARELDLDEADTKYFLQTYGRIHRLR